MAAQKLVDDQIRAHKLVRFGRWAKGGVLWASTS